MTQPKPRLKMVRQVSESGESTYKLIGAKRFRFCPRCEQWKERNQENFFKNTGYCRACRRERERGKVQPTGGQQGRPWPEGGAFAKLDLKAGMGLYIVQFLNAKATRSPKTVINYRNSLAQFALHIGNRWPFTADDIDSFLASKKASGRAVATIQSYYRNIGNFAGWLLKRGKIDANPMEMAEKVPGSRPLPRAPQIEDIQALASWLQRRVARGRDWRGERDLALFSLMIDSGLRVGEVSRLKISDIDFNRRVVTVRNTKTKTDGNSILGLGATANLQAWLKVRDKLNLPQPLKDTLFVTHIRGEWHHFSESGIRQFLARCCRERDLPHITPHQLRHGCAVFSLNAGANIIEVQRQLRHSNPNMTLRYLMMSDAGREERHLEYSPFDKALGGG